MTNNLFPVFDVPSALAEDIRQVRKYRPVPFFDIAEGEFVLNGARQPMYGSGYDAWVLWCTKTILTQRWAYCGYSDNSGIEADEAFKEPDRQATESAFERTITEALLADPMGRTVQARNFIFGWYGDSLTIACDVTGANGDTATIKASIKT
jgi:hypothetical protein